VFSYVIFGIELVGGICLILGLFTRFWAAATAIELAVITFGVYWPNGFAWNVPNGGAELPFLWGMMVLAVALRGGGPYSLDRSIGSEL
jgi:putative oxidoreductase